MPNFFASTSFSYVLLRLTQRHRQLSQHLSVAAAEGVVEFGIAENFVAYGKDEAVWIYVFENGKSYRLTPERENTQFLGVSGGYVMWMDVTSRERDIIKYALPPL